MFLAVRAVHNREAEVDWLSKVFPTPFSFLFRRTYDFRIRFVQKCIQLVGPVISLFYEHAEFDAAHPRFHPTNI